MKNIIIIPAYNESGNIENTVRDILENARGFDYLIVNDCSQDNTLDICRKKGFNYINLPINLGIGGAVQAGYRYAYFHGYDTAVQFDGDGQHDAAYLSKLLEVIEKDEADMDFARKLLRDTIATREEAEELIRTHLQGWEFERVSPMDILLINMAVAELTGCPTIPEKVTVDEYIELSKEFSSDRSRLFINGILDKLILELRSRGRIAKTGRGLLQDQE